METQNSTNLVGDWNIVFARDTNSPMEATALSIREDSSGNQLLDGHSPVSGGPDMVFSGVGNVDYSSWSGSVSVPGYNPGTFLFALNAGGNQLGGWIADPVSGQVQAWVGSRA
jgi:hypothetical protein